MFSQKQKQAQKSLRFFPLNFRCFLEKFLRHGIFVNEIFNDCQNWEKTHSNITLLSYTFDCKPVCTNTIRLVCRTDNFLEKIIFLFQLKNSKKLLFCQNFMNIIGCLISHLIYLRVVVVLGASNLYLNKPNQKNGSNDENKHNFEIFVLN